jgi:AcrR family transcriptional regulator
MSSPLEKARRDPNSMKARILGSARKLFGEYGFHGTTTRMIARHVGIDISTLHYHWGEKADLYEAVTRDINEGLRSQLVAVEKKIKGLPLVRRIEIAIDDMVDYLFENPEIANLTFFQYFAKTRVEIPVDSQLSAFISDIAFSMGLAKNKQNITVQAKLKVLAMTNAIYNFVSGERLFRSMLAIDHNAYIQQVKETLKFYHATPFDGQRQIGQVATPASHPFKIP